MARPRSYWALEGDQICSVAVALDDQVKTLETDESYYLHVTAPRVQIRAVTVYGAMYV